MGLSCSRNINEALLRNLSERTWRLESSVFHRLLWALYPFILSTEALLCLVKMKG